MKFNIERKYIIIGLISFLVIAASICLYYLIFHSESFLNKVDTFFVIASPVVYGIIVAYLLTPIVNYFERKLLLPVFTCKNQMTANKKKYMRLISVIFTFIIVFLFLYAFFSILIPNIITSIKNISTKVPGYVQNLNYWSNKFLNDNPSIEQFVIQIVDLYSEELNNYLNNNIIPQMESFVKTVSLSFISVLKSLWNLLIGLVISIYVLFSKETFAGQAKKITYALFTTKNANQIISDTRFISETFIGFISGKIVDSFIIGCICFAGTSILNLPYPILVSVIVGVTNVIPFFGPYLGAIPCALLIFMENPIQSLYFCIFIFLLQQLDGNVIGPKILGESTGLSGFWVIFSITIFGGWLGVPGMIVGVPFFAVIYAMIKRYTEKKLKKRGLPISSEIYFDIKKIDENNVIIPKNKEHKRFFKFSFFKKADKATVENETSDINSKEQ